MIRIPSAVMTTRLIVGIALVNACQPTDAARKSGETTTSSSGTSSTPVMSDGHMGGMHMNMDMMSAGMMDSMQTHLRSMQTMNASQMQAALPLHRQMVANLLSQMNHEMQQMHMAADAQWTLLTDSLREDLVHMPEMTATQLRAAMPAHAARVMRLIGMHRAMMGGMSSER
jgi:hypothetical protein